MSLLSAESVYLPGALLLLSSSSSSSLPLSSLFYKGSTCKNWTIIDSALACIDPFIHACNRTQRMTHTCVYIYKYHIPHNIYHVVARVGGCVDESHQKGFWHTSKQTELYNYPTCSKNLLSRRSGIWLYFIFCCRGTEI